MNYHLFICLSIISLALFSCGEGPSSNTQQMPSAQELIDKAISLHGGELYDYSDISLSFRDKNYRSQREGGKFQYERSFEEEGSQYVDLMDSDSFERKINGEVVAVPDTMVRKYRNSINSVWYFALLPYKLNDAAVHKKYLGLSEIEGKSYHKIEVTFQEEGGGEDHQDIFVYFIDTQSGTMDHLAYSYETDGGGLRFRKGYNFREVNGMRFADYVNFKGDPKKDVRDIDKAYFNQELDTLSLIELENIELKSLLPQ